LTLKADSPLVSQICPSPNFESRKEGRNPDLLLLHYTGMESAKGALAWLTAQESKVSCHYLVDEEGRITQMVAEEMRAWHAGQAHWAGDDDINSCSIGIEIHNPGHDLDYPDFPEKQMKSVEALCLDILTRHSIPPQRVLAHSDVAPARKSDPGEKFDWRRLAKAGVGLWVEPEPLGTDAGFGPGESGEEVFNIRKCLNMFGYHIDINDKYDEALYIVITGFQRHFRPEKVDGRVDRSTWVTLNRLLSALHPAAM